MNTAELNRRIENLIRLGTIAQVDESARLLRVQSSALLTDWLPWPADIGRNYRRWRPLRLGTQVILGCISGDPAQAVIIGMLYSDAIDTPSDDAAVDLIEFNDGTRIEYNSTAHALKIDCVGAVTVKSPSLVTLDSPQTTATGALTVQGLLTYAAGLAGTGNATVSDGDIAADGISLKQHTHPGDSGGNTGPAQ